MQKILFTVLALFFSATVYAQSTEPRDFRGMEWDSHYSAIPGLVKQFSRDEKIDVFKRSGEDMIRARDETTGTTSTGINSTSTSKPISASPLTTSSAETRCITVRWSTSCSSRRWNAAWQNTTNRWRGFPFPNRKAPLHHWHRGWLATAILFYF